jgi:3-oxoacyl-(acyl-carrier-protein) synthase
MGDAGRHERWRVAGFPTAGEWQPGFVVGSALSSFLGTTGASTSVSNACAASGCAISMAADLIRLGEAEAVLVAGAEAYSRVALACFDRLGALDRRHCRPFAADRGGTVFGEGAAALILESAAHAAARSAPQPYARLAGAGWSCDAYHLTAPEPSGAQIIRAMTEALVEAGTTAAELGCILPHGTGTDLNDRVESSAIGHVLGGRTGQVPLYSLKALVGHTGGAAGALAAVAAALIIRAGAVPGNVALGEQDPDCQVWLPPAATPLAGRYVLINAYAFGGSNISLVLGQAA